MMFSKAAIAAVGIMLALAGSVVAGRTTAQTTGDNPGKAAEGVDAATGGQVYREICQGCHMPNAEGGTGAAAIPALARNPHLADADFVTARLLKGKGGMPAFNWMLEPAQIAAVATYIRTHFGNAYAKPIMPEDIVQAARK